MTNQETCANCGHDKFFHEQKVADYNDKKIGECTAEIGDEGEEYYCPCKKFVPVCRNLVPETESLCGDVVDGEFIAYCERCRLKPQNQSQANKGSNSDLVKSTAKSDTRKGMISKAEVEKILDDKSIEGFREDNTQLWKEELKKRLGI